MSKTVETKGNEHIGNGVLIFLNMGITKEILADAYAGIDIFLGRDYYEGATKFTKAVRNAVKAREGEQQQTRGPPGEEGKASRDYWRPSLNQNEWNLLNRTMHAEIETSDRYLDDSTKWLFKSEKGVTIFAIYGIGDGTKPTPLYAVGGKKAATAYENLDLYMEAYEDVNIRNWESFDRRLKALRREARNTSDGILDAGNGRSKDENVRISVREQEGDRGTDTGRSSEDSGRKTERLNKNMRVMFDDTVEPLLSDKSSMKAPVEETDRIIALHNMSPEVVRGAVTGAGTEGKASRETSYDSTTEASRDFQERFSGFVKAVGGVRLSWAEEEAIRHAMKAGYAKVAKDGLTGRVVTTPYTYLFDVIEDDAVVYKRIRTDRRNIHQEDIRKGYNSGRASGNSTAGSNPQSARSGGRDGNYDLNDGG